MNLQMLTDIFAEEMVDKKNLVAMTKKAIHRHTAKAFCIRSPPEI